MGKDALNAVPWPGDPAGASGRVIAAPAKVNLFLELLGKRPDGYHELQTLIAPVDLYDTLEIHLRDDGEISLNCDAPGIPTDSTNLVWKAAAELRAHFGISKGASIRLTKRIPHEAGLGGGSSDAASTLAALNSIWNLDKSIRALQSIAAMLGSDVPAFLLNGPAIGTGRGENCEAVDSMRILDIVIVNPAVGCSTAAVYRDVKQSYDLHSFDEFLEVYRFGSLDELAPRIHNRLESAAFGLQPTVRRVYDRLESLGPLKCWLAGSGSSVLALGRNRPDAVRIARDFETRYAPEFPDCRVFVARTRNNHP